MYARCLECGSEGDVDQERDGGLAVELCCPDCGAPLLAVLFGEPGHVPAKAEPERPVHYDRQCRPISFAEWVRQFEGGGTANVVARDKVGEAVVQTDWIGLDFRQFRQPWAELRGDDPRPPLIFETLIVGGQRDGCG